MVMNARQMFFLPRTWSSERRARSRQASAAETTSMTMTVSTTGLGGLRFTCQYYRTPWPMAMASGKSAPEMRAHQHIAYSPGCAELRDSIHRVIGTGVSRSGGEHRPTMTTERIRCRAHAMTDRDRSGSGESGRSKYGSGTSGCSD
jgi:hypothetical protein